MTSGRNKERIAIPSVVHPSTEATIPLTPQQIILIATLVNTITNIVDSEHGEQPETLQLLDEILDWLLEILE